MVSISAASSIFAVTSSMSGASANGGNKAQQNGSASNNLLTQELTPEEEQQVQELKARDQEVRAHEQAHATVGGPYAGQPTYEYQEGPDGRRYAVGGEVAIDASPIANNPDATIRKMDIVIRAALAPAEPSPQDRQVAQQAQATRLQAQIEKREQSEQEDSSRQSALFTNPFDNLIEASLQASQNIDAERQNITASIQNALSSYSQASQLV